MLANCIEKKWTDHSNKKIWRKALPLKEGYASTIHSVQGLSISEPVIIQLGASEFSDGLTFTSISRCRKITQLSFFFQLYQAIRSGLEA